MDKNFLIISDDLTGSNDTGIQMTKIGLKTEVVLEPILESINNTSVVLDTESRTISSDKAYKKVKTMTENLLYNNEFQLVYKKIDSTLRGNIIEEVRAISQVYQPENIIVAPAYPKIGRYTKKSVQYLRDVPLMATEATNDPLNPIWTDNIAELFKKEFGGNVSCYDTKQISESMELTNDYIHIFDINNNEELDRLAKSVLKKGSKNLYVGSAGFAEAIFKTINKRKSFLAIIGSVSSISHQQVDYAQRQGIQVVKLLRNDCFEPNVIEKYSGLITETLQKSKKVILVVEEKQVNQEKGLEQEKNTFSEVIKKNLAKIAVSVINDIEMSGVFLSGGDTAAEVIKELGGHGCLVQKELTTGIIQSTLRGGKFDGLKLITKAGAFGNKEDVYNCLNEF